MNMVANHSPKYDIGPASGRIAHLDRSLGVEVALLQWHDGVAAGLVGLLGGGRNWGVPT